METFGAFFISFTLSNKLVNFSMIRINFDEVEIESIDGGGGVFYNHKGKRFTATIVEYNEQNILISELEVFKGHVHGRVASYYENGQIKEEYFEKYNKLYGMHREWDKDGNLIYEHDAGASPEL